MSEEIPPFLFGWKLAEVVAFGDRLQLRSGTVGAILEREGRARCYKHRDHEPPVAACSCGFFARTSSESLVLYARYPFSHLLEVELAGRVLTAKADMRAEHQRVLRVLLLPTCYRCGATASMLGEPRPSTRRVDIFSTPAVTSMCEDCVGARWWTLDEVHETLEVPASWAVPSEALVLHGVGMNLGDH